LAREKKKRKRLRYSEKKKKLGEKKTEYVGREVHARLWDFGREEKDELWQ